MPSLELLHADTYLAVIEGSVGSQAYQHAYGRLDGVATDLVQGGAYSCAFFASAILLGAKLIREPHLRVQGTVRDLEASGWIPTDAPAIGDVLVWEPIREPDGEAHFHIGFFVGDGQAVSNSSAQKVPARHHWTFGTRPDGSPIRRIVQAFTHPTFFKQASYRL